MMEERAAEERSSFRRFIAASVDEIYIFDAGTLRLSVVNESARRNLGYSANELSAMTLLDVFDPFETIQVCVGYEIDGEIVDTMPARPDVLSRARPVYERLDGWRESTVDARRPEDLPELARAYLRFIERRVGAPVSLVGVGPGREQIVPLGVPPDSLVSGARA